MKKTDKAGRRKNDKIEPFNITDDMLLDQEMDEFLRQSMIEEADRMEEELNSDPELMGIGASDDLFLKVKARLQEMGAWEEEEGETKEAESGGDKEEGEREESGEMKEAKSGGDKEKGEGEESGETEFEIRRRLRDQKKGEDGSRKGQKTEERENENDSGEKREKEITNRKETTEDIETESNTTEEKDSEIIKDAKRSDTGEKKGEGDIYQFLSEEDRKALEIGRKIRMKRKKKGRYWRRSAIAAVVIVALLVVGMQGGASRNWILGALDRLIAVTGNRLQIDYQDNQENIKLNEEKEQEAWKKVKEELDIPVIGFFYEPEGMVFNKVDISKKTGEATMIYWYKGTVVQVYLGSGEKNSSFSFISEEDAFLQEEVISNQKIEIKIWNTTAKSIESYAVSFEYQDALYFVSGQLPLEEVEKMMTFIYLY